MRFGVHHLNTYFPELDGTQSAMYRHLFEQVQLAEEVGFDDVWFTEHHFHEFGGLIPDPPVFLAALAGVTSRIHLGVAISVLPLNEPLQNAESYAMVDVASNGRLELGVGRGANPEVSRWVHNGVSSLTGDGAPRAPQRPPALFRWRL